RGLGGPDGHGGAGELRVVQGAAADEHQVGTRLGLAEQVDAAGGAEAPVHDVAADSDNVMHRRFCPTCGIHLFSEAESRPHLVFIRGGTLDDPELTRPAMTIWTSQAP